MACDAPGTVPRRSQTSTTSRTVHLKQGIRLSNRTPEQITDKKPKTIPPRPGTESKTNDTLNILQFIASGLSAYKTKFSHYLDCLSLHCPHTRN